MTLIRAESFKSCVPGTASSVISRYALWRYYAEKTNARLPTCCTRRPISTFPVRPTNANRKINDPARVRPQYGKEGKIKQKQKWTQIGGFGQVPPVLND